MAQQPEYVSGGRGTRRARRVYERGERIFSEGDWGGTAYIIQRGQVELTRSVGTEIARIALLDPGELFGEMALVDGRPRTANATAVDAVELLTIDRAYVEKKIAETDSLVALFMRVIMARFRDQLSRNPYSASGRVDEGGAGHVELSYADDLVRTTRRMEIDSALRQALDTSEFALFYQPIMNLHTGGLAGCEALLRWRRRGAEVTSPDQFVPLAEDTGLIVPIGEWAFGQVCRDLEVFDRTIPALDKSPLYVSVNLSGRQFQQADLVQRFQLLAAAAGADPGRIRIEVTETLLIDNPTDAKRMLKDLRTLGFKIAMDDFGTGYSSFSYLHQYPIDVLKIDRSFTSGILSDARSASIVRALVAMADSLGMAVIAEGVTDPRESEYLRRVGCQYGQGYLFSPPLPIDAFIERYGI